MLTHRATRFDPQPRRLGRVKALAGGVACLYLLFSAFLILCLAHPPNSHSHSDADHHIDFACLWIQKAVSSHAPSPGVSLPAVEILFLLLFPFLWLFPQARLTPPTGRSPPHSLLA